jgi:hypothetical protein
VGIDPEKAKNDMEIELERIGNVVLQFMDKKIQKGELI